MIRRAVNERIAEAVCFEYIQPIFQPIVHLRTMRTVGFEVLARWTDAELGQVSPEEFVPAAQAKSLLAIMTYNLIRTACSVASGWPGTFYLAFNVPPSLLQDPQTMDLMSDAVAETGFAFERVRVEMTEAELIEDEAGARGAVQALKARGMKVVLDDFGTGFSSLVRLNEFDFDEIKIDGGFVKKLDVDANSRKIVAAVVGLGHSLEIPVVAEAVETPEQADYLRRLGCEFAQGWLLGRPVPAEAVPEVLSAHAVTERTRRGLHLSPYHRQYQLEALYASAPVGLCFIDMSKRYVAANDAFCRMINKTPEQVVGKAISEVYTPEVSALVENTVEGLLLGGKDDVTELQFPGAPETFLVYHHPVADESGSILGLSVVSIDITARKAAEQALRDSERQYRNSVELSPTVMWIAGPDGVLSQISPMADEPTDRDVNARIRAWYARVDPLDRDRVRGEWESWQATGEPFETRFRIEWPQGQWRWVRSRARPQWERGALAGWFGAFTDITREVQLEQRVLELETALAQRFDDVPPADGRDG